MVQTLRERINGNQQPLPPVQNPDRPYVPRMVPLPTLRMGTGTMDLQEPTEFFNRSYTVLN
jgi:hypothetical protein